jgi:hypothetical protein
MHLGFEMQGFSQFTGLVTKWTTTKCIQHIQETQLANMVSNKELVPLEPQKYNKQGVTLVKETVFKNFSH